MRKYTGIVESGIGDFGQWIAKLQGHYHEKTGLMLFPGTLNVRITEEYCVPPNAIRLEGHEYGGNVNISIVPCKISGKQAFVLRPDSVECGKGIRSRHVLEIATDVKLREYFSLVDGSEVEIELE